MDTNFSVKLGEVEFNLSELGPFLVEAKRNCYAGGGKELNLVGGVKRLTFQRGKFHYTDEYAGWYRFNGTEKVRWRDEKGQVLWQMAFSGGMTTEFTGDEQLAKDTYAFLKHALNQVTSSKPFRGLEVSAVNNCRLIDTAHRGWTGLQNSGFEYFAFTEGDITSFVGQEIIRSDEKDERVVYRQHHTGGLIIPR